MKRIFSFVGFAAVIATPLSFAVNYDESKVPQYTLPDPLVLSTGEPVDNKIVWQTKRLPEILKLFGLVGLTAETMPDIDQPVMSTVGYHIRIGKHDVTDFDWNVYLDFADRHMQR